jgi:KDO2-lipid IV(A) lauroyltransferase
LYMQNPSSTLPETTPPRRKKQILGWLLVACLWVLHWLPFPLMSRLGWWLGGRLWDWAPSRRRIAQRNIALCFPGLSPTDQEALVREHLRWMGRSLVERSLLWFASAQRLRRLIHIKGDFHLADRTAGPVMWLLPHFAGIDWASPALGLFQNRGGADVYSGQSNAVLDQQLLRARSRFGKTVFVPRQAGIRPIIRAIKDGYAFVNAPDLDHGAKDAGFIPFFGIPACTLLSTGRMAASLGMLVQPIVITMLPGAKGYEVEACPPFEQFPSGDVMADAQRVNTWLENRIRQNPAQYFWVHKRFKTRPAGEPSLYD